MSKFVKQFSGLKPLYDNKLRYGEAPDLVIQTIVYDIDLANLLNVPFDNTTNGLGRYNGQASSNQGFQWTSTVPGAIKIVSVLLKFKIGVECAAKIKNSSLNGVAGPTFNSSVNHCSLASPGPASLITMNLNTTDYISGGNNIFSTSGHTSFFGFERNVNLDNYFAQVTVEYLIKNI